MLYKNEIDAYFILVGEIIDVSCCQVYSRVTDLVVSDIAFGDWDLELRPMDWT